MVHIDTNDSILGALPQEAQNWLESLSWVQRRYVLLLCHLISASLPEAQAEFLDNYTADGLVSRVIQDQDTKQKVCAHLARFHISTQLTEPVLRSYIRQFYIHSAQDARQQPDLYLESALKLMLNTHEKNTVFNYMLGFELLQMIFQMSWAQQERLYRLQVSQEEFIRQYIKPIQYTHQLNGIIVPRDQDRFFARRDYYIKRPRVSRKRMVELLIATFTAEVVTHLGFSIIRSPNALQFDYEDIFAAETPDAIFPVY